MNIKEIENCRSGFVGWLNEDEANMADNLAYCIALKVIDNEAEDITLEVLSKFAKLRNISDAKYMEWAQNEH